MNDEQEFYATTVEEALDKASAALGVSREQLEFEVLDRGSTGFLGIGTRDARIRVEQSGPRIEAPSLDSEYGPPEPSGKEVVMRLEELSDTAQGVEEEPGGSVVDATDEVVVAVDEFMTALIDAMGLDATVDAYDGGDVIAVEVATKEAGLFIGQKGETIDAVQYLCNVCVYRDRPFFKRIVVDSEGYRQRRVEAIQGMAHRTARRALREKRPLSLPPMAAAERRVVHVFLKENPNVTTASDGQEEDRRVIISPV
jgi:spoIIIJ-associated protein